MKKNYQPKARGFTIIEVMIVLAIAGLIMLIVFLAVPALQRTSRNTQRKSDAGAIAAAIGNYINNNGGNLPTNVNPSGNDLLVCNAPGCGAGSVSELARLSLLTGSNVSMPGSYSMGTLPASADNVVIALKYKCDPTNASAPISSSRSAAVLYAVENGSNGITIQCIEQ